ncbi:MAG: hypothetical protein AYK23_00185 [Candidatus Proteinoplasmatales archaeon SG8-5]|nr:MAG: hypothetical protein AYK23_00185 [Candidatus Proteinoplasmatales archaeon SG8-5]
MYSVKSSQTNYELTNFATKKLVQADKLAIAFILIRSLFVGLTRVDIDKESYSKTLISLWPMCNQ